MYLRKFLLSYHLGQSTRGSREGSLASKLTYNFFILSFIFKAWYELEELVTNSFDITFRTRTCGHKTTSQHIPSETQNSNGFSGSVHTFQFFLVEKKAVEASCCHLSHLSSRLLWSQSYKCCVSYYLSYQESLHTSSPKNAICLITNLEETICSTRMYGREHTFCMRMHNALSKSIMVCPTVLQLTVL